MIARTWSGRTDAVNKDAYQSYLDETGVGNMRQTEGNLGVFVLRRVGEKVAEFLLVSLWDSYESIDRFAGPERDKAVYYPEDRRYLLELGPEVAHYEVLAEPDPAAALPPGNAVGPEALFWMFADWRHQSRREVATSGASEVPAARGVGLPQ